MKTLTYVGHVMPSAIPSDPEDHRLREEMRAAEKDYRARRWDHDAEARYLQAANALYRHREKQKARQQN